MIKAIIFDLNGVFITGEPLSERVQKKFGIPVEDFLPVLKEALQKTRLNPKIRIFSIIGKLFTEKGIPMTEEEFLSFYFSGESTVPEMIELAKKVRAKGVKVYLFSNNFKERTEYYRTYTKEIIRNVDRAFFSWETGFVKSDIAAYHNLLSEINLKPDEILYFDDSQENIELAKSLGIEGYVFEGPNKTAQLLRTYKLAI